MEMIQLGNSDRFDEAFFSEPLTAFAQDFVVGGDTQKLMDAIAGKIRVPRRFEYRVYGSAAELAAINPYAPVESEVRALGADFKEIPKSRDIQLGKTLNKGFAIRLDEDEMNADPEWEMNCVKRIKIGLVRKDAKRMTSLLYNGLTATTAKLDWWGGASQDPDSDLLGMVKLAAQTGGLYPNWMLMDRQAWATRIISLRTTGGSLAAQSSLMSPAELGDWLGVKLYVVDKSDFSIENLVLVGYSGSQGLDDLGSIRRFVTPAKGGAEYRAYKRQVSAKVWEIVVEHYSDLVVTGPTLGASGVVTATNPDPDPDPD